MTNTDNLIKQYWNISEELYNIASGEKATAAEFEKLSELNDTYTLTAVALNPRTPVEILQKFYIRYPGIGGNDEEMRIHIVNNPALTEELLRQYSTEDKSDIVKNAALEALKRRRRRG
jgi:hypothetical protein